MRKLASIQTVTSIDPIPEADRIEQARILGWSMVVNRGDFRPGDKAVFFEIDSVVPAIPALEFMRAKKFRVRTITRKGTLGQGLAMPLSALGIDPTLEVGTDVTGQLGVCKWEPPEDSSCGGEVAGDFPAWFPKTDEIRLQSIPDILAELRGVSCYATQKIDGTSSSFAHHEGETWVCGRNAVFRETPTNAMWKIERRHEITQKLRAMGLSLALQGEIAGPAIQSNRLGLKAPEFHAFNVYDIRAGRIWGYEDTVKLCADLGVKMVPTLRTNWLLDNETVESMLAAAEGTYASGFPQEGIVIRPMEPRYSTVLRGRCSFKVINNTFILRTGG